MAHIQKMGLNPPGESSEPDKPVQTASRTPKLSLTAEELSRLDRSALPLELSQAIEALQKELRELDAIK